MKPYFFIKNHYREDTEEIIKRIESILGDYHFDTEYNHHRNEIEIKIHENAPMTLFNRVDSLIRESFSPRNIHISLEIP